MWRETADDIVVGSASRSGDHLVALQLPVCAAVIVPAPEVHAWVLRRRRPVHGPGTSASNDCVVVVEASITATVTLVGRAPRVGPILRALVVGVSRMEGLE